MASNRNIRINGQGYTHVNVDVKITPKFGKSKGIAFTANTADNLEYSNKAKHARIGGTQVGPVQLGVGKAEPECKLEMSKEEFNRFLAHTGDGYLVNSYDMTCTWQLPGKKPQTDKVLDWMIEDDGHKSKVGDAAMVSLTGISTIVLPNGVHPFTLRV